MADLRTERWTAHRTAMRRQLVTAAMRAIETQGPQVSMRQIAAEAQVPKPTLYRFFKDKSALAAAIADQAGEDILAELARARAVSMGTLGDLVHEALTGYAMLVYRSPVVFRFLAFGSDGAGARGLENSRAVAAEIARLMQLVIDSTEGAVDNDCGVYASMIVGVVTGAADQWLNVSGLDTSVESFVSRVEPVVRSICRVAGEAAVVSIDFDAPIDGHLAALFATNTADNL